MCRPFADVRRMHQAGGLVKDMFDGLEAKLLQDLRRSTIFWAMPCIDFRQLQFFAGHSGRAEGASRPDPLPPPAHHERNPHFEIPLTGCMDPGPRPAAADEIAIAV